MLRLRLLTRIFLFVITSIVFVFALLSGSEAYGGGIMGIAKNAPNTLPWLLLFALNYLVFKKELWGGILIALFGLFISWFFNFNNGHFDIIVFTMTSCITVLGFIFIYLGINKLANEK